MAEERRRGDEGEAGPGLAYMSFITMEEVLEKLKLLRYEETFCKQLGFKPFSRHYFALATNPGEQFYNFTSITAWLLQMAGRHFEMPQEYDDPNATISSILDELRQFGYTVEFPPSKLKQGCGEQCIWVLERLADEALKAKDFTWKRPVYPEEEMDEENVVEDESELTLNKMEDDIAVADEDEDDFEEEEHVLGLDDLKRMKSGGQDNRESSKPEEIMESTTDAAEWRLEVERVLPQLKVTIRPDNKDWRVHVEQMHHHNDGINTSLRDSQSQLDRLQTEISRTLEKIGSREKYINSQLEQHLNEFRALQDQLAQTKERYRQGSGGVTERAKLLAEVTEELEKVKQDMEDRGSSMTDGAPLVKIKQAINKIKTETQQMDIRIGVVEHILLQAKLREKTNQPRRIEESETYKGF